jgi:hypothetical protein
LPLFWPLLWPAGSLAGQLKTERLGISFRGLARLEELHPTDSELSKLLLLVRCVTNDPMRLAEKCTDEQYVCSGNALTIDHTPLMNSRPRPSISKRESSDSAQACSSVQKSCWNRMKCDLKYLLRTSLTGPCIAARPVKCMGAVTEAIGRAISGIPNCPK